MFKVTKGVTICRTWRNDRQYNDQTIKDIKTQVYNDLQNTTTQTKY